MSDELDLKELYGEFIEESLELIESVGTDLVALEKTPGDEELISKVFRAMHTLKGNSGFIGLTELPDLAHRMESVLGKLRDKEFPYFPEINDILFKGLDVARNILAEFVDGREVEHHLEGLHSELENLLLGPTKEEFAASEAAGEKKAGEKSSSEQITVEQREASYMRVSTQRLDKLVNLVGELAAGRSRLTQLSQELKNKAFEDVSSFIASISSQIQSEVLSLRMVPIKQLFNKFYRLARDISRPLNKDIELKIIGEETELDKTIIEVLNDPLLHMVRNAISHGLESPEEREKLGKPRVGTIYLRAYHEHNNIIVEVEDDGRGLNPERIKSAALEKGIISAEEAEHMSDEAAIHLIFLSGFSTATEIDGLSGRGVGMDVVKTNIERLGGNIEVSFEAGKGTKFFVRMPLTLAIVQLFLLKEGNITYGIPLNYVDETFRLDATKLDSIKNQKIFMLRGQPIPIVGLAEILDIEDEDNKKEGLYSVVLIRLLQKKVGFIVDDFLGKVETVIKPLGKYIESLPEPVEGISGASILGTGEIVIVLDVPGLFELLGKSKKVDDIDV